MPNRTLFAPLALALLVAQSSLGAVPAPVGARARKVDSALSGAHDRLVELRRSIHRHPEVAGNEEQTARLVAERLHKLGLSVKTGVGGHGVVAVLEGGLPGAVVAYRADMDAMATDLPDPGATKSEIKGVRHICGHDVHTTVGVGIAEALVAVRPLVRGSVKLIFQPAEETATGARAMLDDGVLRDPVPEAIFALHCVPLQCGQVGTGEGFMLPGLEAVTITISGDGDRSAAARAYAGVIMSLTNVMPPGPEFRIQPKSDGTALRPDFLVGGVIRAEANADSSTLRLHGMIKAADEANYARARETLRAGLRSVAAEGVTCEVAFTPQVLRATINDPALERESRDAIRSVVGDGFFEMGPLPPFFSEDFSWFQHEIPGVMYWLGVSNDKKGIVGMPHSPGFDVDEDAIGVGARTMTAVLLDYLDRHAPKK